LIVYFGCFLPCFKMGILFLGCKFWNILGINLCLDISTENY